jgi:potassium efflux system protein
VGAEVGVSYSSDMARVREVLTSAATGVAGRVHDKEPVVLLMEFGDSAVVWAVSIWTVDPWRALMTKSELNEAIWFGLKDAGITIAFPQMDVHFPEGTPATA